MKVYTLEKDLERDCAKAVIARGGTHRKLDVGAGGKGWLDHAFWLPRGRHFIVEFKLPAKILTPLQNKCFTQLKALGFDVYVVDDYEAFLHILTHNENKGENIYLL